MIGAVAMIVDLFLAGAVRSLASPAAGMPASRLVGRIAARLDRPNRSSATLRARALILALGLPAMGGAAGALITWIAQDVQHGWALEIVVLSLLLGQSKMWALVKAGRLAGGGDPHLARRQAVGEVAELVGQRLIGVLIWYGLLGLAGASAYLVVLAFPAQGRSRRFQGPLIAVKRLALLPSAAVAGLVIPFACLVAPRGAPIAAFRALMAGAPEVAAKGLVAGGLNFSLEGPRGWLGPQSGRAKLEAKDVYAAAILYGAVWLVLLGLCVLAGGGQVVF